MPARARRLQPTRVRLDMVGGVGGAFGGGSYEIRLAGRLSDSVLAGLECEAWGLTVSVEPAEMVLYGPVQDQATLGSLLDRCLSHGLEVVEARAAPHIARRAWG